MRENEMPCSDTLLSSSEERLTLLGLRTAHNGSCPVNLPPSCSECLDQFTDLLAHKSRKPLAIKAPLCPQISPDERWMLNLLGAAQSAQGHLVKTLLLWRIPKWDTPRVALTIFHAASQLKDRGINLSVVLTPRPIRRERAGLYLVPGCARAS